MADRVIANDIKRALAVKYQPPEWCLYYEVADDTGTRQSRYADAVAMSIWPSRGYQLHGFEVKVSRGDFLAEMRDPTKADAVGQFCDFWWLVVPKQMVVVEEVPETWGLMELTKAGLRIKKQAPKREAVEPSRGFMAALLRRGQDMQQAHVQKAIEEGEVSRRANMNREIERRTKDTREKAEKNAEWAREFERAFGIKPKQYTPPARMAETFKIAERIAGEFGALEQIRNTAKRLVEDIDSAAPAIKQEDAE